MDYDTGGSMQDSKLGMTLQKQLQDLLISLQTSRNGQKAKSRGFNST